MKNGNTEPEWIETEDQLEEVLTRPSEALVDFVRHLKGPLVVLGAGGKMGPTLCVLVRRAVEAAGNDLEVVAVSRFSDGTARQWLEDRGVRTISCDLIRREALRDLPDTKDVFYLVGLKFGTQQNPARTWAFNTLIPAYVSERYPDARIVALSTGNVYPLVSVERGGSLETDPLTPLGEYANSSVARERVFEFFSQQNGTPMVLVRLNYAVELRYGVLVDIARKIESGEPVDITMGYLNCIWQRDANDMIVRTLALARSPALPLNLTGPVVLSVRDLARQLGELLDRPVTLVGNEAETALLSNPTRACELLGSPPTSVDTMLRRTAHWIRHGGPLLNKPTKFQVRDGSF